MEKRYAKILIAILTIIFVSTFVFAERPDTMPDKAKNSFALPENAVEVAPGVFYLGKAVDKGKFVEGYAVFAKPGTTCGNGICELGENINKCPDDCGGTPAPDPEEPDTSSCYEFLAKQAKWKVNENWIVDPTNTEGLTENFVFNNMNTNIEKWETAANTDILGEGTIGKVDIANIGNLNEVNEVMFGNIDSPGAIGVTIIWGIFGGPPPFRELVEWDMIFDESDFDWSSTGETNKMDFENIAAHELGHAVGLADLYDDKCSEMTMYGYASNGETKKRSLESGDIAGIQNLYS